MYEKSLKKRRRRRQRRRLANSVQNYVIFCVDCLYIDVCIKIASVYVCMWCVHARVQTTGVGGEHMSEWVREWESEFTCFVWLCYCFYRVLLAWWFCSFQLHCISLYFARFCTHVKCVCVCFSGFCTLFSLSLSRSHNNMNSICVYRFSTLLCQCV